MLHLIQTLHNELYSGNILLDRLNRKGRSKKTTRTGTERRPWTGVRAVDTETRGLRELRNWGQARWLTPGQSYLQPQWLIQKWTCDPIKARDAETLAGNFGEKTHSQLLKVVWMWGQSCCCYLATIRWEPNWEWSLPKGNGDKRWNARSQDKISMFAPWSNVTWSHFSSWSYTRELYVCLCQNFCYL